MFKFLIYRVGVGAIIFLVVLTLIFSALRLVPGDPAVMILSGQGGTQITPEAIERVREQLGLDLPLLTQYTNFISGVFQGDLGTSFRDGNDVLEIILSRLPNTLEIIFFAGVISLIVGVLTGSLGARFGRRLEHVVTSVNSVSVSIPVYILGLVLIMVAALWLGLFPAGGFSSWADGAGEHFRAIFLPVLTVSIGLSAILSRMTLSSIREAQSHDWVRTARSLGASEGYVFRKHVLRNSLTSVITVFGVEIGTMIGSSVIVERVFNWPGISSLLINAVTERDYPVVQGVVIVIAILFVFINIVVDMFYGVLDPRVRK